MAKLSRSKVLDRLGGTPGQIDRELRAFAKAAEILSSDHPRLIDEYPSRWIGIYRGRVAASAKSLKSLMARLRKSGVPSERTIIRFIAKNERTLIL
jgi:hypothetical protein